MHREKLFGMLRRMAQARHKLLDSLKLFRQFAEVAGNDGKPFEPVSWDYDSLENREPEAVERVFRAIAEPMEQYFGSEVRGLEQVPNGPLLFVGNHNGGTWSPEIFLFGSALYRRHGLTGLPYGLAHESVAKIPPVARLLIPLGAVRASHDNAARIFASGRNALVYPGGDEDAFRPSHLRDKVVFAGRRGYLRLALRHGVPVVPVVTFGAHDVFVVLDDGRWIAEALGLHRTLRMKVFPITLTIPWGITVGSFMPFVPLPARICIEVLAPMRFEREGKAAAEDDAYVEACHRQVKTRMQACLTRLANEHRNARLEMLQVPSAVPENDQVAGGSVRVA